MSVSFIRLIFFSILLGMTCLFTGKTTPLIWRYFCLNQIAEVKDIQWSILVNYKDSFTPQAIYTFEVNHQIYKGITIWHQKYLNSWAAEESINRLPNQLTVWYDSSSPSFSSLEKIFPFKQIFYMITLWILVLYFWGLHCYVLKKT